MSDVLSNACGGLLPLLASTTSATVRETSRIISVLVEKRMLYEKNTLIL